MMDSWGSGQHSAQPFPGGASGGFGSFSAFAGFSVGAKVTFLAASSISCVARLIMAFSSGESFMTGFPLEKSIVLPSWIATGGWSRAGRRELAG